MRISNRYFKYSKKDKTFYVNGNDTPFATSYTLFNERTNGEKTFDFKESTGSEWDPLTKWIYKSKDGYTLIVGNEDATPEHAQHYLERKIKNMC